MILRAYCWLGVSICWLLRKHKWRRLRKGEVPTNKVIREHMGQTAVRQCGRCGKQRWANPRTRKGTI